MTAAPAWKPVERARVSPLYWPIWILMLVMGLIVFYGVFTPAWMVVRAIAWAAERLPRRTRPATS